MYRIKGRIQHYVWGGKTFLPTVLAQPNDKNLPYAEYWLGIHPGGVAEVELDEGAKTNLNALIVSDKKRYLGSEVLAHFNTLPFLLKVLDVQHMLSIQVHPTKAAAEQGFAKENQLGIALDAVNRNYRDQNHKPEIMVALSDFWLLHGFSNDIPARLSAYKILHSFSSAYQEGGLQLLYSKIMNTPQAETDAILKPLFDEIVPKYQSGLLNKDEPDFWAARAFVHADPKHTFDKGIFSIYLFNIVKLKRGQGIFQGAGMPHAYLEGQNIELMSNSDNVLRAGLTPKYIDISELLLNTQFVETIPQILNGDLNENESVYPSPVLDFGIRFFHLKKAETFRFNDPSPAIILILQGSGNWSGDRAMTTENFDAVYTLPLENIEVLASTDMLGVIARVGI